MVVRRGVIRPFLLHKTGRHDEPSHTTCTGAPLHSMYLSRVFPRSPIVWRFRVCTATPRETRTVAWRAYVGMTKPEFMRRHSARRSGAGGRRYVIATHVHAHAHAVFARGQLRIAGRERLRSRLRFPLPGRRPAEGSNARASERSGLRKPTTTTTTGNPLPVLLHMPK